MMHTIHCTTDFSEKGRVISKIEQIKRPSVLSLGTSRARLASVSSIKTVTHKRNKTQEIAQRMLAEVCCDTQAAFSKLS